MKTIAFERLIAPSYRRSRLLVLCSLGFLLASLYIFSLFQAREEERNLLSARLERMRSTGRMPPKLVVSPRDLEFQKKWSQFNAEREFPWRNLFQAIEKSSNKRIELLEMVPDKNSRLVILRGEAKDLSSLTEFIQKFSDQKGVVGAHLSHQELIVRERLETISFEIKAKLL